MNPVPEPCGWQENPRTGTFVHTAYPVSIRRSKKGWTIYARFPDGLGPITRETLEQALSLADFHINHGSFPLRQGG